MNIFDIPFANVPNKFVPADERLAELVPNPACEIPVLPLVPPIAPDIAPPIAPPKLLPVLAPETAPDIAPLIPPLAAPIIAPPIAPIVPPIALPMLPNIPPPDDVLLDDELLLDVYEL